MPDFRATAYPGRPFDQRTGAYLSIRSQPYRAFYDCSRLDAAGTTVTDGRHEAVQTGQQFPGPVCREQVCQLLRKACQGPKLRCTDHIRIVAAVSYS